MPWQLPWHLLLALGFHLGCFAIGNLFFPKAQLLTRFAIGWMAMALQVGLLSILGLGTELPLEALISVWCIMLCHPRNRNTLAQATNSLPKWSWPWAIAITGLLVIRFTKAGLPLENWDSLNHHLPLLLGRIGDGTLNPLMDIPTDRRTPFAGVWLKSIPIALDPHGRVLVLTHLLAFLIAAASFAKERMGPFALLSLLALLSLTDLWIYVLNAGDEAWMATLTLVAAAAMGSRQRLSLAVAVVTLAWVASIKLTGLLIAGPLGLALLWKHRSRQLFVVSLFALILTLGFHGRNLVEHDLIYPLNRWSNLLAEGPVFSSQQVRLERAKLGLADNPNNHPPLEGAWMKLQHNLGSLGRMALGPFFIWSGLVLLVLKRSFPQPSLLLPCIASCLLAGVAWEFSPQAYYRYLLPTWALLTLVLAEHWGKALSHPASKWMHACLALLFFLSISLEGKALFHHLSKEHSGAPMPFWVHHTHDGPFYPWVQEHTKEEEGLLAISTNSVLFAQRPNTWLAQVGNEAGWRRLDEFPSFFEREKIHWILLSNKAESIDSIYSSLLNTLADQGHVSLHQEVSAGKIFRVVAP